MEYETDLTRLRSFSFSFIFLRSWHHLYSHHCFAQIASYVRNWVILHHHFKFRGYWRPQQAMSDGMSIQGVPRVKQKSSSLFTTPINIANLCTWKEIHEINKTIIPSRMKMYSVCINFSSSTPQNKQKAWRPNPERQPATRQVEPNRVLVWWSLQTRHGFHCWIQNSQKNRCICNTLNSSAFQPFVSLLRGEVLKRWKRWNCCVGNCKILGKCCPKLIWSA